MRTAPLIALTWSDDVTGRQGHLVIDRLVRGVCSGGLRMREGCTAAEVAGLARGMTMKEALHYDPDSRYVPLGGAKGGIDCDPRSPEAYGVLVRYLKAMRPYIERFWTTGEDLGLTQELVDRAAAEAGLVSSIQAVYPLLDDEARARRRLAEAFEAQVDGIGLDELAGGCGVAESVLVALERAGHPYAGTRVSVQGFGTMGGATARFLARAGLSVVAVADVRGTITHPDGLDVEALLAARDGHGTVDRAALRPGDREEPGDAWLAADAEVLVPAAVSYAIDTRNQAGITARWIVEAANMPVLPAAEELLAARGITVLPDVVVNSATNAWWWWTLFGDITGGPDAAFAHIRTAMRALVDRVLDRAEADGSTPRAAAHGLVGERLTEIAARYGTYGSRSCPCHVLCRVAGVARVRLSVAERREELLRAAVEQIEARGVAAVRIADVASALGVSNALVLYHFSTKEKLVAEAFAYAAEGDLAHLRRLLGRRTTALRRLRAAVRWYAPTGQAKGWRLWIEGWAACLREPALREVAGSLDQQWKAALTRVIAEGAAAGEFPCADPAGAAWRLTAFLDGLAVQMTSYAGSLSRAAMLEWADAALARELGLPSLDPQAPPPTT